MAIQTCPNCGAKNRINETLALAHKPICGKCGAFLHDLPAGNAKPQIVTDASFSTEVIEASSLRPVLVDAWAEWCGPCRMIAPVLDQLAAESQGRYRIAKVNVDENPQLTSRFQIASIPTLLIFRNGQLVDRLIGVQPKQVIAERLQVAVRAAA